MPALDDAVAGSARFRSETVTLAVDVARPFGGVACEIEEAVRRPTRDERADRCELLEAVARVDALEAKTTVIGEPRIVELAPGIRSAARAARRAFELRFAWQARPAKTA